MRVPARKDNGRVTDTAKGSSAADATTDTAAAAAPDGAVRAQTVADRAASAQAVSGDAVSAQAVAQAVSGQAVSGQAVSGQAAAADAAPADAADRAATDPGAGPGDAGVGAAGLGEAGPGEAAPGAGGPAGRRRIGLLAAVAALVLTADLVSKIIVVATLSDRPPARLLGGLVYLVEARNAGAAFSFAQGATVLFTAIAALVIVVILRTASQLRSLPWAVCLGLILGGAAGNLADRVFRSPGPLRGRVVDWISVLDPAGQVWPVFNLADSSIVVGGVLAVLLASAGFELTGTRARRGR